MAKNRVSVYLGDKEPIDIALIPGASVGATAVDDGVALTFKMDGWGGAMSRVAPYPPEPVPSVAGDDDDDGGTGPVVI